MVILFLEKEYLQIIIINKLSLYENKEDNYFALSNSFLLLEEYLIGKQNMTFNKDFADNLIVTGFCSFSMNETLINEIKQIPSDSFVAINIFIHWTFSLGKSLKILGIRMEKLCD